MFNFSLSKFTPMNPRKSEKKSILCSIILALFVFTFVACDDDDNITPTPSPTPVTAKAALTSALEEVIDETEVPGFTIAIVKNGELAIQSSFGYADITSNKPYTNQTTQTIGSISKTFIGAAIVKAIEEGYFTLDTDINELLPVELVNPKNPDATITLKHLVTHTSGLLDNEELYNLLYRILPGENMETEGANLLVNLMGIQQREGISIEDLMGEYYLEGGDLYDVANFANTTPGQAWNYSNIATTLTAYIIENATGKPYDQYVTEKIFVPLGMTNTNFTTSEQAATLYFDKNTPLPLYGNDSYPDGSVHTSNEDLTKYMQDMMKGVAGNSTTLFSKTGYELLFQPLLVTGVTPPEIGTNQSVFWVRNGASISHTGGDPGLSTLMEFSEDGQTGILLLTNMDASTDATKYIETITPILEASITFLKATE